jgi:hypothetical protein
MAQSLEQLLSLFNEQAAAADRYIEDLIGQAGGDRDFVIRQLKRDHELALGTDDKARAEFLESVADKLEERIGTIPYDYQVGTTRTTEDLARTEDVTKRNTDRVLSRLAEDEQVWKQEQDRQVKEGRIGQQEGLLKRGILQGTREEAQGLAGEEVGKFETDVSKTLETYNRALGRQREDVTTSAEDTLFEARRTASRQLSDLKTAARRGATGAQDKLAFGTEAANRQFEARRKELERLRAQEKASAQMNSFA